MDCFNKGVSGLQKAINLHFATRIKAIIYVPYMYIVHTNMFYYKVNHYAGGAEGGGAFAVCPTDRPNLLPDLRGWIWDWEL